MKIVKVEIFCHDTFWQKLQDLLNDANKKRIKYKWTIITKENGTLLHKVVLEGSKTSLTQFIKDNNDKLKKKDENTIVVA